MENVLIIGAGLSGLSTAYNLKKENISCKILEAQNRVGGRIETISGKDNTPMEMGATWFGKDHKNFTLILSELNVGFFEQHNQGIALFETMSFEPAQQYLVPANTHSAYRIKGGTYSIIEALYKNIGKENIVLNSEITEIIDEGDKIKIKDSNENIYYCKHLIVSVPPKILFETISFSPALPTALQQVMENTQTWMSGSAKFSVEYNNPFWRVKGFSGSVYSQSGFAPEIYDHCNFEHTKFALKGFLNNTAKHFSFEERREKLIAELKHHFGRDAINFISYNDKIWNNKYIQPEQDSFLPPHNNNGNTVFHETYMNGKLFFTGTETSRAFGGYMEGAILAAKSVAERVLHRIKN